MAAIMQEEQKEFKPVEGLFETLNSKFRPQYNETILSLQYANSVGKLMKMQNNGWGD